MVILMAQQIISSPIRIRHGQRELSDLELEGLEELELSDHLQDLLQEEIRGICTAKSMFQPKFTFL